MGAILDAELVFDGSRKMKDGLTLEGGDLIVLSEDLICIGISERTTPAALDMLLNKLAAVIPLPFTVLAVVLPRSRATIHLDMVCNQINTHEVLVHEPVIAGGCRSRVVQVDVNGERERSFRGLDSLADGLRGLGRDMEVVVCGGNNPVFQQREQWLSGANVLTFAPGKIIGYSCNNFTFEELNRHGYEIKKAADFVSGKENIDDFSKLAVGIDAVELARGGGGIRCMTMPIERES
jgi:arginine deiminase